MTLIGTPPTQEEAETCRNRRITLQTLRREREIDCTPDADQLEKDEQREITRIYLAHSCKVRNLSQPRKAKYLSPGMPDLFVVHRRKRCAWWHEAKRPVGGSYSPAQVEFMEDCFACGVDWIGGDRRAAVEKLQSIGLTVDL